MTQAAEQPPRTDMSHGTLMRRATYAAVAVATTLILAKLVAWAQTGSVAVLASLLDSILDVFASLLTLFAVRHSLMPADKEHRFGHGKAEPLAGLGQAAFIAGSSTLLLLEAGRRLWRPHAVEAPNVGIGVMVLSIVLTLCLVWYQRRVIAKTNSLAISGDSLHYVGDVLANIAVIVGLLLTSLFGWLFVDSLFGAGIALFLYYNAWRIAAKAMHMLMDHEMPDPDRDRILAIAANHAEVASVHDLRTRTSGPDRFIQFHLEMDGAITLTQAHTISDDVEAAVLAAFPGAEIIIHQDPAGLDEGHPSLMAAARP
ncbi:MAG: cation diffusion facilitator family transporter [Alphaproteobacteria bacterium]